ncbi:Cas1p-domain-containing protein [Dentipellis sp. KUC8613]|nr:Cas1p-domain-containing protein [Dentipellis sp. KUC8613]
MVQSRPFAFSVNPLWPHYVSLAAIVLAFVFGLTRYSLLDSLDPHHCGALLNSGRWLDTKFKNWQPDGCMTHAYQPKDAEFCLASSRAVFLGDSVTRKLFFQFANIVDPTLPTSPPDDDSKHSDHLLHSRSGIRLSFYWDPFLNSTQLDDILNAPDSGASSDRPTLLVLGSGLWYLRYADMSGGISAWEANTESIINSISQAQRAPADEVVVLPIEDVIASKLSYERATTMLAADRDAMNSDLYHRIHPTSAGVMDILGSGKRRIPISLPLAFNDMLDPSQTEDGLHFSDVIVRTQANLLLNLRCNDRLPKVFPLDKTCCRSYPWPHILHLVVLVTVLLWGPYAFFLHYRSSGPGSSWFGEETLPPLIVSGAISTVYLADRTGFWVKEQKQFDPWTYGFLNILCLVVGLVTVKRGDKDLGFLNREQTDEWKGWMQIAILIYHYFGASKISGVYNPIRVLVAAYLYMTGYGHTTFYIKKADFGFKRVAQVMIRLNFFTMVLAYTMNTDYISYYFAPLVSTWYLILYVTMALGSRFNERTVFLVGKILLSMGLVTWFMSEPWLLQALFDFLSRFCHIHWSAKEWAFRFNLDLWIVYFGMLSAVVFIKIREYRLTDHQYWPLASKIGIGASALVMVWFFIFELAQPDKFVYNGWHPYISFLPVGAFVILRNANPILRSATSRFFAFFGTCSLETFIIQYHLWLGADTKGILIILPWTRWRSLNMVLTAVVFVYISYNVSWATGEITSWICGDSGSKKQLPTTTNDVGYSPVSTSSRHDRDASYSPVATPDAVALTVQGDRQQKPEDRDSEQLLEPPMTPIRPRRWVDRLAEGPSPPSSSGFRLWYGGVDLRPGLKTRVALGFAVMWVVNILWTDPH